MHAIETRPSSLSDHVCSPLFFNIPLRRSAPPLSILPLSPPSRLLPPPSRAPLLVSTSHTQYSMGHSSHWVLSYLVPWSPWRCESSIASHPTRGRRLRCGHSPHQPRCGPGYHISEPDSGYGDLRAGLLCPEFSAGSYRTQGGGHRRDDDDPHLRSMYVRHISLSLSLSLSRSLCAVVSPRQVSMALILLLP